MSFLFLRSPLVGAKNVEHSRSECNPRCTRGASAPHSQQPPRVSQLIPRRADVAALIKAADARKVRSARLVHRVVAQRLLALRLVALAPAYFQPLAIERHLKDFLDLAEPLGVGARLDRDDLSRIDSLGTPTFLLGIRKAQ